MPATYRQAPLHTMTEAEAAWAAGFMSVHGSFTARGGPGVIYQVRTSQYREAAERFARLAGVKTSVYVRAGKETTAFDVRGYRMVRLMALVWDHLTESIKRQWTIQSSPQQRWDFGREYQMKP